MTQDTEYFQDILTLLAAGLLQQDAAIQRGITSPVTTLNIHLYCGWETLTSYALSQGCTPPETLREFVTWLHTPITDWNLSLPTMRHPEPLLIDGVPTDYCHRIGGAFANVGDLRLEMQDAVFCVLYDECRKLNDPALHGMMREFLVSRPVLDDILTDIQQDCRWPKPIRDHLKKCYEPLPAKCICQNDGVDWIARCPHCGWVLAWAGETAICHKGGVCAEAHGNLAEDPYWERYHPAMRRTINGIQRYVVAPEVALLTLRDELINQHGVRCELFPHFDAYDMLITFTNGEKWAVNLKDYRDPSRLGASLKPFVPQPKWDKAFIVLPPHRRSSDYLQRLLNRWTARGKHESALFADDLLREVGKRVR
jgi:hypothetical protein